MYSADSDKTMETRAIKRQRLAPPTTDPLEMLPIPLIQDLILQHFTGKEVMELFKVSKEWNKIVSTSSASMKKTQLEFLEKISTDPSPKKVSEMLKSQRKYYNMKCRFMYRRNVKRKMLLLETFSHSLVELSINVQYDDLVKFAPRQLPFPKLKSLTLKNYSYQLLPSMKVNYLVTLELVITNILSDDHSEQVASFLKKQPRLKRLTLLFNYETFKQIFSPDLPFALTFLSLSFYHPVYYSKPTEYLNVPFLRKMLNSLETFIMRQASSEDIKLVFNTMPNLKTFKYADCITDNTNLERNESITTLAVYSISASISKSLILALENLQELEVGYNMIQNFKVDFKWIVNNVPKLMVLRCKRYQVEEIRKYYQMLKDQDTNINQNIEISSST